MNHRTFEVLILGSNSALPVKGRSPSAQIVNIHEQLLLIDCGEGTQFRLAEYRVKRSRIDHILISHLHGDHVFGLPGLITSYNHSGRKNTLHIYGPESLDEYLDTNLRLSAAELQFELDIHILSANTYKKVLAHNGFEVYCFPLDHRIPTVGYLIKEKHPHFHLDGSKIQSVDIKYRKDLQSGNDVVLEDGTVLRAVDYLADHRPARSYAYCSDTRYCEKLLPYIQGVDLLYHETTYLDEMKEKAKETGHSTARQAAEIARKANAGCLVTGHYSSRYDDLQVILDECLAFFPNTVLGIDGLKIRV